MKIQRTNYKGNVQNLGRKDFSAPMRLANLKASNTNRLAEMDVALVQSRNSAVQKVVDQSANELYKLRDDAIRDEAQSNLAKSQFGLSKHLQDVEQKQYFKAEEIPVSMRSGVKQYGDMIPRSKVQAGLLKDYMQEEQSRLKESMSPQAYDIWAKAMEGNFGTAELDTQNAIFQGEITLRKQKAGEVVEAYVENLDSVSAVKYINDSPLYSPAEKKVLIEKTRQKVAKENIYQAIESGDPERMFAEHEHLNDPGYQGVLTGPARINLASSLKMEISKATKVQSAALARANALELSELEVAISRGKASYEDIDILFNQGKMTPAKRTQLITAKDRQGANVKKEAAQIEFVANALATGMTLSRSNKDHTNAIETFFMTSPESAEEIAVKTGYLPKAIEQTLDAAAATGKDLDKAADFYAVVNEKNPAAFQDLSADTRATLVAMRELSLTGDEALELINTKRKMLPSQQEAVEANYRAATKEDSNAKALHRLMSASDQFDNNAWFGMNVEVDEAPARFTGEYNALVKSYYYKTGDLELSQKAGFDALKTRWRLSAVNGKDKLMRNAPEALYNAPSKLLHDDLKHQFGKATVLSDELTLKDRSYVVYKTVDDLPVLQAKRWTPDPHAQQVRDQVESIKEAQEFEAMLEARRKKTAAEADRIMRKPVSSKPMNVTINTPEL